MKKIMVLGAGTSQVPLICAARRSGYRTIVASVPGDYPGFQLADFCCYTDISDPEAVLRQAERYEIDGIITCGMDTGIQALGRVCDALGLPGISQKAAENANDKALSNKLFKEHQVNCASSLRIGSLSGLQGCLPDMPFPAVLKAVDLMGSRGVYICQNEKDLLEAYECILRESHKNYCILEEFVEGIWAGAEGMITDGVLDFLIPYGTEACQGGAAPISLGHWMPAMADFEEQILKQVTAALEALDIRNGPFDCDLMLKDGKVYIIEINGRAGATGLAEMVGAYYGVDYYEILCRQAMGEKVQKYFDLDKRAPSAVLSKVLISGKDGILKELSTDVKEDSRLVALDFAVHQGDPVRKFEKARDRLGFAVVQGSSLENCRQYMEEVLGNIHIDIG